MPEKPSNRAKDPSGKAAPGELRAQVARTLADRAHTSLTVTEIANILGRSGGAVGNACDTLTRRGEAELATHAPRRFRATALTESAARVPGRAPVPKPRSAPAGPNPSAGANPPGTVTGTNAAPPGRPRLTMQPDGRPVPLIRSSGQRYHPRSLAGVPDVEALWRLRTANVPVLLYGPPGTGKTSLAEAAFPDLVTVAGDGDTTVGDLIGEYTQNDDGSYTFVYGPLVTAMQEGRALLLDDATLIAPKVLAALYPAMDGRRQIQVKAHKGETITAADGFYVIAGHDPGVHGAVLSDALASRFSVQIKIGTDYDLASSLKINSKAVRVARNLARRCESGEISWAPQLRELIAFQKVADALGDEIAFANLVGVAPEEDRDTVKEVVAKTTGTLRHDALTLGQQL